MSMISYLKGTVITQGPEYIITEVGGIGYKVNVALNRLSSYPVGREVEVYCHLHLKRDETMELYGVESPEALVVFETLNGISGIGPKAALAISSLGTMSQLRAAIDTGDAAYFSLVKGIGQKKIQRIILELTGKLKSIKKQEKKEDAEVIDALVSLGFSQKQAKEAASLVPEDILSSQERVKLALQAMKGSG